MIIFILLLFAITVYKIIDFKSLFKKKKSNIAREIYFEIEKLYLKHKTFLSVKRFLRSYNELILLYEENNINFFVFRKELYGVPKDFLEKFKTLDKLMKDNNITYKNEKIYSNFFNLSLNINIKYTNTLNKINRKTLTKLNM